MRGKKLLLAAAVCAVAVVVAWLAWLAATGTLGYEPLRLSGAEPSPTGTPWSGAVHVHSNLSADATGSVDEIVDAARQLGLHYVLIADHTRALGSAGRVREGWYGDVLVLVGEEISTYSGHVLALGVPPHPFALGPTARQALDDIQALGGAAIVAHPAGGESAWQGPWSGVVGMEVSSLSSAAYRAGQRQLVELTLAYPWSPVAATARLLAQPDAALGQWSELTAAPVSGAARQLVAVGAVDAHGPVGRSGVPSYAAAMGALNTVVWMDGPPQPGEQGSRQATRLLQRLRQGRAAVVVEALGSAPGLSFGATRQTSSLHPGDAAPWTPGWTLEASLGGPGPYRIELLHDGEIVASADGQALRHEAAAPGTYRAEIFRTEGPAWARTQPWIVVNPIYLRAAEASRATSPRRVPPLPAPPENESLLRSAGWAAEAGEGARSALALQAEGLRWELRMPNVEERNRYAAVAWRPEQPVDWAAMGGLSVALESEREWRLGVRLWTRAPGGGERTWERVVRSSPEAFATPALWREFWELVDGRPAGEPGALEGELQHVVGLALVVTPQRMRPGAEATVVVRQIGPFGR